MGDKSPKSKKRNEKQKTAERTQKVASAKAKQDRQSTVVAGAPAKGKRGG